MKTVAETFGTRRDALRLGGIGLASAAAEGFLPRRVSAGSNVTPRGNARNVLFYEINGAISHLESWDFKETAGTPDDLAVTKHREGLYLSEKLFPSFKQHIDKFAILRTLLSHEEVHFRGQTYVQTGRPLNLAFASEIPGHRLGGGDGVGTAARPERHLPHVHVVQLGEGIPRSTLHGVPRPALLRGGHQPRDRWAGLVLKRSGPGLGRRALATARQAARGATRACIWLRAPHGQLRELLRRRAPVAVRPALDGSLRNHRRGPRALRRH